MRKLVATLMIVLATLLVLVTVTAAAAPDDARSGPADTDIEAVRATAEHYLKGHATGDPEEFRKAFHPEMRMLWVKDGQLQQRTAAEFIAGAKGKPADDEAQRKRRIVSVDVTGSAAVVKLELDYPKAFFTDYLSMLKIGGEWRVIAKTFHVVNR